MRDFNAISSALSEFLKNCIYSSTLLYLYYYSTNSLIASINRIHLLHLWIIGLVIGRLSYNDGCQPFQEDVLINPTILSTNGLAITNGFTSNVAKPRASFRKKISRRAGTSICKP